MQLNTLGMVHEFLERHVREGALCIDATAGRGRDTAFLCRLVGETGRVLALDLQPQAVEETRALLEREGLQAIGQVLLEDHTRIGTHAAPGTVDAIVFNLGWLPGGDHAIRTGPDTTLPALEQSLELLKPGGVLSLCLYYGGVSGYEERDAVLGWLETVDPGRYTVLVSRFVNRTGDPPIPVFIRREG